MDDSDVTRMAAEIRRLNRELEDSRQRFDWVTDTIEDVYYLIDPDTGQMSYVSPAYEVVWGRSRESVYSNAASALDAVHEDDRQRISDQIPIQDSRSRFDLEYRIRRPDGSIRWLHDRGFVVRDADGAVVHYLGVASDITDRKAAEAARFELGQMDALKRVTSAYSHDLSNILSSILVLTTNLMDERPDSASETRPLRKIAEAVERGMEVLTSLQTVAHQRPDQPTECLVSSAMQGVDALLEGALGALCQLRIDIDAEAGAAVLRIDQSTFTRSLLNLAVNARQAMPRGGSFTLRGRVIDLAGGGAADAPSGLPPGQYLSLEAIDTGTGMSAETRAQAFDTFFSTRAPEGGTGLGLSVVHAFARGAGGAAEIRSTPGQGSTIRLLLPTVRHETAGAGPSAEPATHRVLLVDDEAFILEGLKDFLQRRGFEVDCAADGAEALETFRSRPFDIVVTDLRMPGMWGDELARTITDLSPSTPVLIMSGLTASDETADIGRHMISKKNAMTTLAPAINAALAARARQS